MEGDWRYDVAAKRLKEIDFSQPIDFVYAHNDMMAIAAREHFQAIDPVRGKELHIIGMDAVANAGLEAVADGRINVFPLSDGR